MLPILLRRALPAILVSFLVLWGAFYVHSLRQQNADLRRGVAELGQELSHAREQTALYRRAAEIQRARQKAAEEAAARLSRDAAMYRQRSESLARRLAAVVPGGPDDGPVARVLRDALDGLRRPTAPGSDADAD